MVQIINTPVKFLTQARTETKDYEYDLSSYLPNGVSLSSATATLTSPAGVAGSPFSPTLSNNDDGVQAIATSRVTSAMLTATGTWKLDVLPTLSNGELADAVRFEIVVPF